MQKTIRLEQPPGPISLVLGLSLLGLATYIIQWRLGHSRSQSFKSEESIPIALCLLVGGPLVVRWILGHLNRTSQLVLDDQAHTLTVIWRKKTIATMPIDTAKGFRMYAVRSFSSIRKLGSQLRLVHMGAALWFPTPGFPVITLGKGWGMGVASRLAEALALPAFMEFAEFAPIARNVTPAEQKLVRELLYALIQSPHDPEFVPDALLELRRLNVKTQPEVRAVVLRFANGGGRAAAVAREMLA